MPKSQLSHINLYYEITGQGDSLLFIHGLGSSTRDWALQVAYFSKHYRVITVDVRGHGQSDKPPGPYSVPLFAADIAEFLKALDLSPVHMVGLSMGGAIIFQLAVNVPHRIKSMVIANSAPEVIARTFKEYIMLYQRLFVVRFLGMRKMGEILAPRLFPKPEQEELRLIFIERWAENDKRAYFDALQGLIGWSVVDRLSTIRCPTLVISADRDLTPVSDKEAYVAKIPQAKLVVIKDAHHATPVERPKAFNKAVMTFLTQQT